MLRSTTNCSVSGASACTVRTSKPAAAQASRPAARRQSLSGCSLVAFAIAVILRKQIDGAGIHEPRGQLGRIGLQPQCLERLHRHLEGAVVEVLEVVFVEAEHGAWQHLAATLHTIEHAPAVTGVALVDRARR